VGDPVFDTVGGYRLEVPPGWADLTGRQRSAMQNGIGPDRWDEDARAKLDAGTQLKPAADVHDVDYCLGRTTQDRKDADQRFLRNCRKIIMKDAGGWIGRLVLGGIFKAARRALVARLMYRALRLGGKAAFNAASKTDSKVRGTDAPALADEESVE